MAAPGPLGVVLTGGAGRRMGRDKALLDVAGRPMAARVATALEAAGLGPVRCVGGDIVALRVAGLEAVADDHPGEGPLGGVLSALRLARAEGHAAVVVLACDLLAPSTAAIGRLLGESAAVPDASVVVPVVDGRHQWLHALWRVGVVGRLAEAFAAGQRAPRAALDLVTVHAYDEAEPLADADTPADLPGATGPQRGGRGVEG